MLYDTYLDINACMHTNGHEFACMYMNHCCSKVTRTDLDDLLSGFESTDRQFVQITATVVLSDLFWPIFP